jgi:glycosyltransferase involved in cell wall biosynthesis
MALTVGNVEKSNLMRKGLGSFVAAADYLPDVSFVLIGAWRDETIGRLRVKASSNVTFTGFVDDDTLGKYYRRASVYVQASRHEGFGRAVAEAMLQGCIPVVARTGALPEVVGDCGVYADSAEPADLAAAIEAGLAFDNDSRERARMRVRTCFSLGLRRLALYDVVEGVIHGQRRVEVEVHAGGNPCALP